MSTTQSTCPVCDASVPLSEDVQQSEVVTCPDCHVRLVVASLGDQGAELNEAPEVEEDWGE